MSQQVSDLGTYLSHLYDPIDFDYGQFQTYCEQVFDHQKPLARILKKTAFYGQEWIVEDGVFIPRHETEFVVATLLKLVDKYHLYHCQYVDLCAGTGCIGLTVGLHWKKATNPTWQPRLVDTNPIAIVNIFKNMRQHNVKALVYHDDWCEFLRQNPTIGVISANFPYVGYHDQIEVNLVKNEPHDALFANHDGLEHYEKLLDFLTNNEHWKLVVLEVNSLHKRFWRQLKNRTKAWKIELVNDLEGQLRVVSIYRL